MRVDISLEQMHRMVLRGATWDQVRPFVQRGLDVDTAIECAANGHTPATTDEHVDALAVLVRSGTPATVAAALDEREAIVLARTVQNPASGWAGAQITRLAERISAASSPLDVPALVTQNPDAALLAADGLGEAGLSLISQALAAGVPLDDLTWLGVTLGATSHWVDQQTWSLVAQLPTSGQRRLAMVLLFQPSGRGTAHVVNALVRLIDSGHDEIARYVCDGMEIDDAISAARAQAALDRNPSRAIKNPSSGRMTHPSARAQSPS